MDAPEPQPRGESAPEPERPLETVARSVARTRIGRGELLALLVILLVGLLARASAVALIDATSVRGDQGTYQRGARAILTEGELYSGTRGPGYSAFVATTQWLAGKQWQHLTPPRVGNVVLGLLLILLVWATGRLLFSPLVGLVAAGWIAGHPRFATFPLYLFSENLYTVCVAGGLYLTCRSLRSASVWTSIGAGVLFGLGMLTREMLVYFVPLVALGVVVFFRRTPAAGLRRAVPMLLVAFALVAPWTVRNYEVYERFVPIGFADGIPLFEGNYVPALEQDLAYPADKKARRRLRKKWEDDPIKEARWKFYHQLKGEGIKRKVDRNDHFRAKAMAFIRERQPGWIVEKIAVNGPKLIYPVVTTPTIWGLAPPEAAGQWRVCVLGVFLPLHVLLLLLAPIGLVQWRLVGEQAFVSVYLAFSFFAHIVANVGYSRFQYPYEWILVLMAASVLHFGLPRSWRQRGAVLLLLGATIASQVSVGQRWSDLYAALRGSNATLLEDEDDLADEEPVESDGR